MLREQIILPAHLRMPLHSDDKSIGPRIFERFDDAVCGPRGRNEIAANRFNRLVMMAVDERLNRDGAACQSCVLAQTDVMRRTIAWRALLVLDRIWHLRVDVLDQRSTTRHVKHLHPETD